MRTQHLIRPSIYVGTPLVIESYQLFSLPFSIQHSSYSSALCFSKWHPSVTVIVEKSCLQR